MKSPNSATPINYWPRKDIAWRSIFWVSLPPGILFVIGSFMVAESPRWLFRRGKKDAARAALLRSRTDEQAEIELKEMEETAAAEKNKISTAGEKSGNRCCNANTSFRFWLINTPCDRPRHQFRW